MKARRKQEQEKNKKRFVKNDLKVNYDLLEGILKGKLKSWELIERYQHEDDFGQWESNYKKTKDLLHTLKIQLRDDDNY